MPKKIFITGGHMTPAVAVIDAILTKTDWDIYYIGRNKSSYEDSSYQIESNTIGSYGNRVKFLAISTGKLQRFFSVSTIVQFIKIPLGFIQSLILIINNRPDIVLSFGGYVAFPISTSAFICGVPIVTHEQTKEKGFANSLIEKIAKKVLLSWPTEKVDANNKYIITGLPVRRGIYNIEDSYPFKTDKPLLYISGGSQGSHIINNSIRRLLPNLLSKYSVIHQCGNNKKTNDLEISLKVKESLPKEKSERYYPVGFIDIKHLGWVYKHAKIAVGRSGANTVYELASVGVPAIFIPLPFSQKNEQEKNAEFFKINNAGIILHQNNLNDKSLLDSIDTIIKDYQKYHVNAQKLKLNLIKDADNKIVEILNRVLA